MVMFLRYAIAIALWLATMASAPVFAQQDIRLECRQAAAYKSGETGVAPEKLDTQAAIRICRTALANHSDDADIKAWLARALHVHWVNFGGDDLIAEALDLAMQAADAGSAEGMFKFGSFFERGDGVARDRARALALYRKSAEAGFAPALSYLIIIHSQQAADYGDLLDYADLRPIGLKLLDIGDASHRLQAVSLLTSLELVDMFEYAFRFEMEQAVAKYEAATAWSEKLPADERGNLTMMIEQQSEQPLNLADQERAMAAAGFATVGEIVAWADGEGWEAVALPEAFHATLTRLSELQSSEDVGERNYAQTAYLSLQNAFRMRTFAFMERTISIDDSALRAKRAGEHVATLKDLRLIVELLAFDDREAELAAIDAEIDETTAKHESRVEQRRAREERQRRRAIVDKVTNEALALLNDAELPREEVTSSILVERMMVLLERAREIDSWEEAEGRDITETVELVYARLALSRLAPLISDLANRLRSRADIPAADVDEARLVYAFVGEKAKDVAYVDKAAITILEAEARLAATSGDAALATDKYEAFFRQKLAETGGRKSPVPHGTGTGELGQSLGPAYRAMFEDAAKIAVQTGVPARERLARIIALTERFDRTELFNWIDETTFSFDPVGDVEAIFDGRVFGDEERQHAIRLSTLASLLFLSADRPRDVTAMLAVGRFMEKEFGYYPRDAIRGAWYRVLTAAQARLDATGARAFAAYLAKDEAAFARHFRTMRDTVAGLYDPGETVVPAFDAWRKTFALPDSTGMPELPSHADDARQLTALSRAFQRQVAENIARGEEFGDSPVMSPKAFTLDVKAKLQAVERIGRVPVTEVELDLFFSDRLAATNDGNVVLANMISRFAAEYYLRPQSEPDIPNAARHMSELAGSLANLGAYDESFDTYERALSLLSANGRAGTPQYESIAVQLLAFSAATGNRKAIERTISGYEGPFAALLAGKTTADGSAARVLMRQALEAAADALEADADKVPQPMFASVSTSTLESLLVQAAELELAAGDHDAARVAIALVDFIAAHDALSADRPGARQVEAQAAFLQGRFADAARMQDTLIASLYDTGMLDEGARPFSLAAAYFRLSRYLRAAGNLSRALEVIEDARDIAIEKLGADNPAAAAFFVERAAILTRMERNGDALADLQNAFRLVHEPEGGFLYRNVWSPGVDDSITPVKIASAYVDALWRGYRAEGDQAYLETAFKALQGLANRQASQAILDAVSRRQETTPELAGLLRRRQDLLRSITAMRNDLVGATVASDGAFGFAQLEALQRDLHVVGDAIAGLDPQLGRAARQVVADLADIRSRLSGNEAVLLIRDLESSTHVILASRDQLAWHRSDVAGNDLFARIAQLRQALVPDVAAVRGATALAGTRLRDFAGRSAALYRDMLAPVLSGLRDIDHLIVSANAPLDAIPLQILVASGKPEAADGGKTLADVHWLLNDFAVTVAPTLAGFRRADERVTVVAPKPFFGVGAPRFAQRGERKEIRETIAATGFRNLFRSGAANTDAIAQLLPLPESEAEVRSLAASLGGETSDMLFGAQASEAEIRARRLEDFRVLAFATHGLLAGELGGLAEPALVFTPGGEEISDDGLLTMSEVAQLSLNADWVLLSACNTAGDNGRPGSDAFSGLAQAFLYAGARNIVVSHWPVNSDAAVALTSGMARELRERPGVALAQAMRRSMLTLIRAGHADPAIWGPFSIISSGSDISG